jgi:hypothetical protein
MVREKRPGSIQTIEQEKAVRLFEMFMKKGNPTSDLKTTH